MPALIAWLLGLLESAAGSIVISALVSLGFSFVSYKFAAQPFENLIRTYLSEGGQQLTSILGFLGLDQCVTMIFSAIAARYAVQGASHLVRNKKAS
jgi:peptidoglycan/LPS O-acetylase OafA/YrhL